MNTRTILKTLLLFILLGGGHVMAQKINWDNVILPPDSLTDNVEEKLVQIAWANYPQNQTKYADVAIAKAKLKHVKVSFLENFGVGMQINSQQGQPVNNTVETGGTIQQVTTTTSLPRVGFGIQFGLGQLLTTPYKIKTAKEEVKKTEHEVNLQKVFVRQEVISRYNLYKSSIELLRLYAGSLEQVRTVHSVTTRNYENGTTTIEAFQQSFGLLTTLEEKLTQTRFNVKVTKASLEELLGLKLEEIIQQN